MAVLTKASLSVSSCQIDPNLAAEREAFVELCQLTNYYINTQPKLARVSLGAVGGYYSRNLRVQTMDLL